MIFFDIDGTIMTENTHICSESTRKAIKTARENGHLVFINTGRPYCIVTEDIREIGFDGYVCGCGTYVEYDGEVLFQRSITHESCLEIVEKLREYKVEALFESFHGIFFDQTTPDNDDIAELKSKFGSQGIDVTKSWDDPGIFFDKFVVWINEDSDFDAFYKYITGEFDYIDRGNNFGEIVPKGYSKATGIKLLQEHLNIPLEDCYAAGDSTNDLPMLEYVPNSIAMGNSTPELFDKVSFITRDIEQNGIEYALRHYGII